VNRDTGETVVVTDHDKGWYETGDFSRLRNGAELHPSQVFANLQQPPTATWTPATESAPPESAIGVHVEKAPG
jgi:hypothetical protein